MRKSIFLPSDIYAVHEPEPGAKPKFVNYPNSAGGFQYSYYSTGRLENARARGDEVWVLLEKRHLTLDFCQWWITLVPKDRLISVSNLISTDDLGTLDELRSASVRMGAGIDKELLRRANTWMRLLHLIEEKGFVRGHSVS